MTKEELNAYIFNRLGAPVVKVELTDEQLDAAIFAALNWFNANRGLIKVGLLTTVEGQKEYKLPSEVKNVFNVYFVERGFGGLLGGIADIMQDFGWAPGLVPLPRGRLPSFSGVVLFLQKMEDVWRIAAREPTWEFKNGTLFIYPAPTSTTVGNLYYDYTCNAKDIEELSGSPLFTDLIARRVLAECKEILSRIRGKYSSYPTAEGTVSLDADTLRTEAIEEKTKLDEEILEKTFPAPFVVG